MAKEAPRAALPGPLGLRPLTALTGPLGSVGPRPSREEVKQSFEVGSDVQVLSQAGAIKSAKRNGCFLMSVDSALLQVVHDVSLGFSGAVEDWHGAGGDRHGLPRAHGHGAAGGSGHERAEARDRGAGARGRNHALGILANKCITYARKTVKKGVEEEEEEGMLHGVAAVLAVRGQGLGEHSGLGFEAGPCAGRPGQKGDWNLLGLLRADFCVNL